MASSYVWSFKTLICCLVLFLCTLVAAQEEKLPTFGDTVKILGAMERTDQDFQDGLALDLFSPSNRTLVVSQNKAPLSAQYVSGTTGEPYVALSNYSYIIKTNDNAKDLIAKIEVPYDPVMLSKMGIQESNTYVGTLSADKKSWVIDETKRNVHRSENNTRIIKMTSLDGEYMLMGRKTVDATNIFVQYGFGATRTVNFTGGPGVQEAEFVDGLRFSAEADKPMGMNVDLANGINPGTLPANTRSLNSFAWIVNTTDSKNKVAATMKVPFNRDMLFANKPNSSTTITTTLVVAKRALNASSGQFQPVNVERQSIPVTGDDRVTVPGLTQLDGQYILLVSEVASTNTQNGNGNATTTKVRETTTTTPAGEVSGPDVPAASQTANSTRGIPITTSGGVRWEGMDGLSLWMMVAAFAIAFVL